MPLKDPTEWMEDLTVFLDDDEITELAAQLELGLMYRGSKLAAAAWLSLVGTAAGAFAAATFSAEIRSSVTAFAVYLVVALALIGGLRPATSRLFDKAMVWPATTTFFWAALLACCVVFGAAFASPWLAYGLSAGGGFFVGMLCGALNTSVIKREDTWRRAALGAGVVSAVITTLVHRILGDADTIAAAASVGAIAGGTFSVPMSVLLFRLWDEAHGFKRMAVLLLHNDNFASKAVSYLDNALALAPADAELYNLRGVARSKMDDPKRAVADWKRASELNAKYADPHLNCGVDHLRRGEFEQAIDALGRALTLDPENATAHCNLGTALERWDELDRAIEHFDRAIALHEGYANAYSNRSYARFRKGDYEQALADCEQALKVNPEFAPALVNRGHVLGALGRHRAAAESYQAALQTRINPELQEEALRGLESLAAERTREAG
jgi:Flp pilus assembly protein TadD